MLPPTESDQASIPVAHAASLSHVECHCRKKGFLATSRLRLCGLKFGSDVEETYCITYCFDIDGTLCSDTSGAYEEAEPFRDRIAHVNRLFKSGHTIRLFTARGSSTGLDWRATTERQLSSWGVQYHELIMGKPHADLFIDDKACHSEAYAWD